MYAELKTVFAKFKPVLKKVARPRRFADDEWYEWFHEDCRNFYGANVATDALNKFVDNMMPTFPFSEKLKVINRDEDNGHSSDSHYRWYLVVASRGGSDRYSEVGAFEGTGSRPNNMLKTNFARLDRHTELAFNMILGELRLGCDSAFSGAEYLWITLCIYLVLSV